MKTKILFKAEDIPLAIDLISDLFYGLGVQGVLVEGPDSEPVDGWGKGAEKGSDVDAVVGYLPKIGDIDANLARLKQGLERLEREASIRWKLLQTTVNEEDWAESWKSHFAPTRITPRIVVKPSWRELSPCNGDLVIQIDPGMAFGTGTHPTTALCIAMLEKHIQPGDRVLDVGTGSGILMIAAALLGASYIRGVDSDPVAVEIAAKNLFLNNVQPDRFSVARGHLTEGESGPYNLIVANILTDTIITLLDQVPDLLSPAGLFIGSGIIEENGGLVMKKMAAAGFDVLERMDKESWVAVAGMLNCSLPKSQT